MSILSRLLQKRGVTESELSAEEKIQFDNWKKILSEGELTVSTIKEFCQRQIGIIEGKWKDFEYQNKEKLLPYHSVYKSILGVIDGPKVERENLEKYLNQLLEQ